MIFIDFETYFDKDYSLRKMTPAEYILDARFECIGCAVIDQMVLGNDEPIWLEGNSLVSYFNALKRLQEDGQKITVGAHNALFDMCILAWKFNLVPDMIVDTMAMSRAIVYPHTGSVSLEKVAEYFGLPPKGKALKNASGMSAAAIKSQPHFWREYTDYAKHDVWLCREILRKLVPDFPRCEYEVVDMVARCAIQPQFQLDMNLLAEHRAIIEAEKQGLLARCGLVDRTDLMSNDKFADALRRLGVDPPMKPSPATGKETYAFAKTDPAMVDLAEADDPRVQALVAARVGHRSTIEETRVDRLIKIGSLQWTGSGLASGESWSPIPLRYSGAHTHRLSGDWKLNPQNWPRTYLTSEGKKEAGKLRRAHRAPPGYLVVKCDASQIEARIVAWLARQEDLLDAFRQGRDIYSEFASEVIYGRPVGKDTPDERFVGKGTILGCGFGMGAPKFKNSIAASSYLNLGYSVHISDELAVKAVNGYRRKYPMITAKWREFDEYIIDMCYLNHSPAIDRIGPIQIMDNAIILPTGMKLQYPDLKRDAMNNWTFQSGRFRKKLFGGKLFENVVQALARIITTNAALEIKSIQPQYRLAHFVHDDLVYIVPEAKAHNFAELLQKVMSQPPSWAPDLPLAAEYGIGPNYGDAK